METTIKAHFGEYKVIQYAGLLCRRILTFIKEGQIVNRGDALGLIKFSSRVDILLPKQIKILAHINDIIMLGDPIAVLN